jgi:hypothetical protein
LSVGCSMNCVTSRVWVTVDEWNRQDAEGSNRGLLNWRFCYGMYLEGNGENHEKLRILCPGRGLYRALLDGMRSWVNGFETRPNVILSSLWLVVFFIYFSGSMSWQSVSGVPKSWLPLRTVIKLCTVAPDIFSRIIWGSPPPPPPCYIPNGCQLTRTRQKLPGNGFTGRYRIVSSPYGTSCHPYSV